MIILDIFYLESYPINFITHSLFFDTLFWTGLSLGLNNKGSLSPPKTDEFPENFRTAFAPPPRPFFEKFHCDFFRKFITKITVSNAKKIAMKFFGSEMTPPFRKFSGNSFESGDTGFPKGSLRLDLVQFNNHVY